MQARGANTRLVMDFESGYGIRPNPAKGAVAPFNTLSLTGKRESSQAGTITGRRDPTEPIEGNLSVSGEVEIPVDGRAMLGWLKAMFGPAQTEQSASLALGVGPAVDLGGGLVGLPCPAHGLAAGSQIMITGSDNYDGVFTVNAAGSENEIAIAAAYQAEEFNGNETLDRCARVAIGPGPAADKGGGMTGLPCPAHGLPPGAEITVSGSVNHDGTFAVDPASSEDEIVIQAVYQAEEFDGSQSTTAMFHDHVFTIGPDMPSLALEKQFPDLGIYALHLGCRVSSLSMEVGGEGELTARIGLEGADEQLSDTPHDPDPVDPGFLRFNNFQAMISEGGQALGNCVGFGLEIDFGLDGGQYLIGGGGIRAGLPEGAVSISGNVRTLFEDRTLLDKAVENRDGALELVLSRGHHRLSLLFPAVRFSRNTPGIDGPQGILVDLEWRGFHRTGSDRGAIEAGLRTDVKTT